MSHPKILLRALPNVEFVHGYPGIPPGPERPQATIRGTIEVRLDQPLKTKWLKVEFRKVETIPSGNHSENFIDSVGQSPMTVWEAKDEYETLSSKDFPFMIRVPETIPPSVALGRGAGIKYEVVATLCMKEKKGLLRREAATTISHAIPVVIDKHELHSTWPVYAQPESRHVTSNGLTLVINRSNTCFSPADRLGVMATLKSDNLSPVVLRAFEFSLKETITYKAGPQSRGKKNGPQVHISILGEQKVPVSMTLYGGTQHKAELGCIVPINHTTSSVNAGRHIDIGYTLSIKAILDKGSPIGMDLPVTVTNWPRHVSAEMIRRIGAAPNLTLTPPVTSVVPSVASASDLRPGLSPSRSPPVGLPHILNNGGHRAVSSGALVSGPPGSTALGNPINGRNPYLSGLYGPQERPLSLVSQQIVHTTSRQNSFSSVRPDSAGGNPSSAGGSNTAFAASDNIPVPNSNSGSTTEYGSNLGPGRVVSHGSQNSDTAVIDVTPSAVVHSPAATQVTDSDKNVGSDNRISQSSHSQSADARAGVSIRTSSTRRRATSRTFKIVNATDDISEEDSPVKVTTTKPFDDGPRAKQSLGQHTSPNTTWPTSEDEKQRLFDSARAQAERVQAQAKVNQSTGDSTQTYSSPSTNHHRAPGRGSPSYVQPPTVPERPRTSSPSSMDTLWPTAEDEKRRLFEQAQANVRRTQSLAQSPHPSPATNNSTPHSTHQRTGSANSLQDSGRRPYVASSHPKISAGAALYSHAIASMKNPIMAVPDVAQTNLPNSQAPMSQTVSPKNVVPSFRHHPVAGDGRAAVQHSEAQLTIQQSDTEVPPGDPIAYDALFPAGSSGAPLPSTSRLSEKEILRRAYEARDAAAAANQPLPPASTLLALSGETPLSNAWVTPPSAPYPEPPSEKELLRRAFEARDAAMIRSGQLPQAAVPMQQSLVRPDASASSQKEEAPPSEKDLMRLAFEIRDRALAAQQPMLPPEYGLGPPTLSSSVPSPQSRSDTGGAPLATVQETAQHKTRYVAKETGSRSQTDGWAERTLSSSDPAAFEHTSSPTEESVKSESSEGHLRRDPTISAGKKRASQMIVPPPPPPPPLLPRPPAEYIEETKLEDMKNNSPTFMLPITRSSPLDISFIPIEDEQGASSSSFILS